MGVAKKTRKFGQVKRLIGQRDARLKTNKAKEEAANKEKAKKTAAGELIREAPQMPSNMFFQHNTALVPPYNVLVDTNFLSHTVQRKLSLLESMMDCLYAKCNPIITSCVMAELESLGPKYRLALRVARDERWQRLECDHKGTYADDCLVDRVSKNRIYIVGTNDRALKQRLRKIPGVPLMSVARGKGVFCPTPPERCTSSTVAVPEIIDDACISFFRHLHYFRSVGAGMDQPLGDQQAQSQPQKRTRVLLSCAPCRNSKLKCDRGQPCGQCARKSAPETCVYAPKPTKKKRQPKGMAARLKRLEGMVRDMMDSEEGGDAPQRQKDGNSTSETPSFKAQVVQSNQGATYVGATHCMAILEDIEDMKSYFDDEDDAFEGDSPSDELDANDLLIQSGGAANREELLALLPEKHVADRLIMRYFGSFSPAQLVIHRPTFTAKYAQFWQDPDSASLNWLAQLFMILALGIVFSNFASPHELQTDSDVPVMERVQLYRSCAGKALVWGKYTNPTVETIPAFILYVEAYFMFSRAAQMSCYVLSGVCVRLLLKMGMHRDPSKLANISPFECEVRRRCWAMAAQVELLVSFHMGLPSMLHGIESDTGLPGNYQDEDFGEDSTEFPPERPLTDHTSMSYPLNKTKLLRVFSQIAKQAHALTPPSHAEVMRLDALVNETWNAVPSFLHVKPLENCIGDSPALMIQRFGLESLHHKSRCVLHRRYLAEPILKEEHDYSRQQCLQAAVTLLNYQATIWNATRPGNILSSCGWFVTSLAVHDYMLAVMILYLVIHNGHYPDNGDSSHWTAPDQQPVSKDELKGLLKRSHAIWCKVSSTVGELRKTRDTLAVMLAKIGDPVDGAPVSHNSNASITSPEYTYHNPPSASSSALSSLPATVGRSSGSESGHHSTPGIDGSDIGAGVSRFGVGQVSNDDTLVTFPPVDIGITSHGMFGAIEFDSSWMEVGDSMDWRSGSTFPTDGSRGGVYPGFDQAWEQNMDLGRRW